MSVEDVLAGRARHALVRGDCVELMRSMPEASVDLVFCSPPYNTARLYLEGGEDIGIARNPDEWVAWMLTVCEEARRVCKGLCAFVVEGRTKGYRYDCTPFLLLADLHRRGFNMRKPPIYRRAGIPGSGGPDWWRNDYEPVVCFSRPGRLPWSDNVACGEAPKYEPGGDMTNRNRDGSRVNSARPKAGLGQPKVRRAAERGLAPGEKIHTKALADGRLRTQVYTPPEKANPGNVISGPVGGGRMGSELAHENEAPFPEWLAERFVLSFCPPGGVCLDIFSGSGTTAAVAVRNGRRALGFDLRQSQIDLGTRRLASVTPDMFASAQGGTPDEA